MAELPRPLRAVPFLHYAGAKAREDDLWQEYMATTSWATPSGRVLYKDTDPKAKQPEHERIALLDQWHEHAAKRRGIVTVQAQAQAQEIDPDYVMRELYGEAYHKLKK